MPYMGGLPTPARPRKDFCRAVSPYVARKVLCVSHETAEHDLRRVAPKIAFGGFVRHAEDFPRDVRAYRRTEGLTFPGPFPSIPTVILEGSWRGEGPCKALPPPAV